MLQRDSAETVDSFERPGLVGKVARRPGPPQPAPEEALAGHPG
jgi:hypothetical protein